MKKKSFKSISVDLVPSITLNFNQNYPLQTYATGLSMLCNELRSIKWHGKKKASTVVQQLTE